MCGYLFHRLRRRGGGTIVLQAGSVWRAGINSYQRIVGGCNVRHGTTHDAPRTKNYLRRTGRAD